MIKNFRTYELAVQFHKIASTLGLSGDAKDQLSRAASSVVLNLAEGYGRQSFKDKKRFYVIAMGSLRECQAILDLSNPSAEQLDVTGKLGAYLHNLIKSLE